MKWLAPMLLVFAGLVMFLVLSEVRDVSQNHWPEDLPVRFAPF